MKQCGPLAALCDYRRITSVPGRSSVNSRGRAQGREFDSLCRVLAVKQTKRHGICHCQRRSQTKVSSCHRQPPCRSAPFCVPARPICAADVNVNGLPSNPSPSVSSPAPHCTPRRGFGPHLTQQNDLLCHRAASSSVSFLVKFNKKMKATVLGTNNQSVALEELYNFTFGSKNIGRSVRPQTKTEVGHLAEKFAAERLAGLNRTQKTFDRVVQQLSIGV